MNPISRLLPNLGAEPTDEADELSPEQAAEERQRRRTLGFARSQHLVGMGRVKYPTTGQERRRAVREVATRSRKATKRHHRAWFANQHAIARLRGQVDVIDHPDRFSADFVSKIEAILVERYGDLETARERNAALQAEQADRRRAQEAHAAMLDKMSKAEFLARERAGR